MSTSSLPSRELEARILLSQRIDDEDEIDGIIDVYKDVCKHIGFHDRRRDKRFIVKFHGIDADDYDIFDSFCEITYNNIIEDLNDQDINPDDYLTIMTVGHYQAFRYNIPDITEDNALSIAEEWYNEYDPVYHNVSISEQITIINALQYLEDTYLAQWREFIKDIQ